MKKVSNKLYKARKIMDYTGVVFLVLLLLFIWQLYRGPVAVPFLKPYIIKALNHDDSEYQVTVDAVNLELVRSIQPIKIIANNVVYKKNDGTFIINAPKTSVSFSIRALLRGVIAPSSVEISAPSVYLFTTYGIGKDNRDEVNRKKLEYYFDAFEDFVERFNSEDRAYPESYINDISVKNAELEFHEVDLGRKWVFSDLNYTFERNFTNIETDFNALLKLKDRISTVGIDAEYRPGAAKLALRFYFSDLVPADVVDTFLEKQFSENLYGVNLPVSGKVDALIDFEDVLRNKDDIVKSLDTAVENIDFQFEGGQGNIMFSDNEDFRYNVSSFLLEGNIDGGVDKVNIKDADFDLGGQKMKLGLQITGMKKFFFENSLRDLKISASAYVEKLAFDDLNKYWPRYIAEDAWLWVKDSIYGGEIRDASFRFDFDYDAGAKGLRFSNLDGRGTIVDSNLNYLKGMPDIRNMYGTAYFNSDSIKIDVDKGVSDGANPNAAINRAQMVTMLWRAVGQPTAGGTANFTDVPTDSYYAQAVAWAVENGITTGVGGGIIRDLIVGNNPPLTFQDPVYLVVSIITSIIVFLPIIRTWIFRETRFYEALMLLFDSIGLGIFTVNGIQTAYQSTNIHGIILLAFVGVITGCGGGVLRDMMAGDRPYIFVKHFYASASLLGALACILLWNRIGYGGAMLLGATLIVVLRMLAARKHWSLPKANHPEE